MISQFNLKTEYSILEEEIQNELNKVFSKTNFIRGENVDLIEKNIADYIGVKYAVSCNSGTDALHFALKSIGISAGDEVITTPFTFVSTIEAIMYLGAKPVFADINLESYNIDKEEILKKITKKTKAILPVHLFGNPINIKSIRSEIGNNDIKIIEDCAQSFGAGINCQRTGSIGDIGCFSFYPTKNLGCYGDGGMVTTNSKELYENIKKIANHGSSKRYHHDIIGYNSRLDEIQAAILNVKIKYIDKYNMMRSKLASIYDKNLKNQSEIILPKKDANSFHVYHQYTINTKLRDKIQSGLKENDIGSAIYYPISLENQNVYKSTFKDGQICINSNYLSKTCLSLPMYPHLKEESVIYICDVIKKLL
tara:strand:+ start:2466 stop:3563 length:1098 start_codon:yes stop_codon:yes gene_type:complete